MQNGIKAVCRHTTQEYPLAMHFRVTPDGNLKIYKKRYGSAIVFHPAGEWKRIELLEGK